MAEEKLGTLQYEMLISEDKLKASLANITELIKKEDIKWKSMLSGVGGGDVDMSKMVAANKKVTQSTDEIKGSIKELRIELKKNLAEFEATNSASKASNTELLATIQKQKDQIVELGVTYRQVTAEKREAARAEIQQQKELADSYRRMSAISNAPDEIARLKAINKELEYKKQLSTSLSQISGLDKQINANNTLIEQEKKKVAEATKLLNLTKQQELQRAKIVSTAQQYPTGTVENINSRIALATFDKSTISKADTAELGRQSAFIKKLNDEKKALIATNRQQALSEKQLALEEKLKLNIESQAVGSIGRLRAENALYTAQISKLNPLIAAERAEIIRLNQARNANNTQIQNLQPTIGMWGKLVSAIKTYATAYISVQAVMGLGRAIFTQTKELDSLRFSMSTVIKSSVELAATQKYLSDVAINYGGDLLNLSEQYIRFRAATTQANMSASDTQKIFESVSKASGVLGLRTDQISNVYLALEQMVSKGTVMTEELRRQLGNVLPGAFGIMAAAVGVTVTQLGTMMKKQEVISKDALPKFAIALEKAYGIESVKKVDTLAAAQGRMSTQFTMLIKDMEMSSGLKSGLNFIAGFIGFIRDNIGWIGLVAKSILYVTTAMMAYKVELYAVTLAESVWAKIQTVKLFWTTKQIVATEGLTGATLEAAVAQNTAAAATSRWSVAVKTFGGWVGILVNLLVGVIAYFAFFKKGSDDASIGVETFSQNFIKQTAKLNILFDSLVSAKKGTIEYKDTLLQINAVYAPHLKNLLTEKSSIDEVTKARNLSMMGLINEMNLKEKRDQLEKVYAAQTETNNKLTANISKIDPNLSAAQKGQLLSMVQTMGVSGENEVEKEGGRIRNLLLFWVKQMAIPSGEKVGVFTSISVQLRNLTDQAIKDTKKTKDAIDSLNKTFPIKEPIIPKALDLKELKNAEEEFANFDKLQKLNEANKLKKGDVGYAELADPNYSERFYSYKNFLETKRTEFISQSEEDLKAREAIDLKLAEIDKKAQPAENQQAKLLEARTKAIEALNAKYLADQEDFANYDMGIEAGRIAAMEDGIEKEKKLNELAYENKIKAIEKEKILRLKLVNEAAGIAIGSKGEVTSFDVKGLPEKAQAVADKGLKNDIEYRANAEKDLAEANIKTERDYQYKLKELRRDANDQFLSGIQKEKAAINEKYDDWVHKAGTNKKLIDEIEGGRKVAISEVDRQNAIDRLDFEREIQYKKNEIIYNGNQQSSKLEEANFEVYYNTELKRGRLLLQSANLDKQQQGRDILNKLLQDVVIQDLTKEEKLRNAILASAKELSGIIAEVLGLTNEEANALNGMVDISSQLIEKGLFSKEGIKFGKGEALTMGISGATQILSIILNQAKENKAVMADYYASVIKQQNDYNLALNEQLRLNTENNGIMFIDNTSAKIKDATAALIDATDKKNKAMEAFYGSEAIVGKKNVVSGINVLGAAAAGAAIGAVIGGGILSIPAAAIGAVIGGFIGLLAKKKKDIVAPLLETYPEIIKANGEFNVELAKTLVASGKVTAETKAVLENVIAWDDAAKKAVEAIKAIIETMVGAIGTDLKNALVDAFVNGTDAAVKFGDSVKTILEDILTQQIFNAMFAPMLANLQTETYRSMGLNPDGTPMNAQQLTTAGTAVDYDLTDDARRFYALVIPMFPKFMTTLTDIKNGVEQPLISAKTMTPEEQARYDKLEAQSKAADAAFWELVKSGKATKESVDAAVALQNKTSKDFQDYKNSFLVTTPGIDLFTPATTTPSSMTKAIQSVTEDTARRLEGLINSMRETGVINMGNVGKLVESSQAIQGYAAQSLGHLVNIDNNIASQLAFFNDLMSASGTTGRSGLRVVMQ